MFRTIGMIDLRKRPGQVLDETFYRKELFLIKRNKRIMAALIPIEDFLRYFEDEDIEMYTPKMIKEFQEQDRLTPSAKQKIKNLLAS